MQNNIPYVYLVYFNPTTSDSIGDAGDILIDTDLLSLFGKSRIISKTTNTIGGNAGKIEIETQNLLINGPEAMISTSSNGSGMGGSIIINAETIDLQWRCGLAD